MKKFAIINLWKITTNGHIKVTAVADTVEELTSRMEEHDEIVMVFEEDGQIYYSRDLDNPTRTFKGHKEDMDMADSKALTFEVNGTEYNSNEKGNRFYKTVGTQKVRIGEAEWNGAFDAYISNIEPPAVDEWEAEADAERQARYDKMAEDALKAAEALNPKEVVKTANETVKKAKKKAKKNVAFEGVFETGEGETFKVNHVTLTEKQVDFIKHLPDTCFYENGVDSALWIDVLADEIGGQFKDKPMTVGAMVSTLREKGIVQVGEDRINGRKCKFMTLSELGKMIALELGLN